MAVKLTYDDGRLRTWKRNFTDGVYNLARLYPTSSNYSKAENSIKTIYTQPGEASRCYRSNLCIIHLKKMTR